MKTKKPSCPSCGAAPLKYEDQTSVGGPKEYGTCTRCEQEQPCSE